MKNTIVVKHPDRQEWFAHHWDYKSGLDGKGTTWSAIGETEQEALQKLQLFLKEQGVDNSDGGGE